MSNPNETVRDVCAEMRYDIVHDAEWFADRILAAYECEMAAKDERIALLERALKPIMALDSYFIKPCESWKPSGYNIEGDDELHIANFEIKDDAVWAVSCDNAVREAQRIMKEGEEK